MFYISISFILVRFDLWDLLKHFLNWCFCRIIVQYTIFLHYQLYLPRCAIYCTLERPCFNNHLSSLYQSSFVFLRNYITVLVWLSDRWFCQSHFNANKQTKIIPLNAPANTRCTTFIKNIWIRLKSFCSEKKEKKKKLVWRHAW